MNIRKNNGFTGVDISIALIVLVIFVGTIATVIYNFEIQSKAVQRKSEATSIMIDILEYAKSSDFENVNEEYLNKYKTTNYQNKKGYDISVTCKNDIDVIEIENTNNEIKAKKVEVDINYLVGKSKQNLTIYTWILKD